MSRRRRSRRGGGRVTTPATSSNTSAVETDTSNLAERRRIEATADLAFATGQCQYDTLDGTKLVVVPDVVVVECVANGHNWPDGGAFRIVRADGRVAYLYRWPSSSAVPT
jgi:hypothetical protein